MPTPISIYSASSVSAVVGLNPYRTPRHAWQIIMEYLHPGFNASKGWTLPPFPDSAAIRWGNAFEEPVIKLAEEKHSDQILDREKTFMCAEYEGYIDITCHVDGIYQNMENGLVLHEGKTTNERAFKQVKDHVARWGDPGTDQVPEEYQVQAAIQRICSGADLVKLSVLVFPKTADDFEALGWECGYNLFRVKDKSIIETADYYTWAKAWAQQGQFHTYNLPTNKKLESTLIEVIQEFDARYVKTQIPPDASNYADVARLLINPIGTIEATPEIKKLINDHIELGRQLGAKSPLKIRREKHKVEICNFMTTARKKSGIDPSDKMIVIDPNGGDKLATLGLDKNGKIYFRTKSAE